MLPIMLCASLLGKSYSPRESCRLMLSLRDRFEAKNGNAFTRIETHYASSGLKNLPKSNKLNGSLWSKLAIDLGDNALQSVGLYENRSMEAAYIGVRSGFDDNRVFELSYGKMYKSPSDWNDATASLVEMCEVCFAHGLEMSCGWVEPLEAESPARFNSWKVLQALQASSTRPEGLLDFYSIETCTMPIVRLPCSVVLSAKYWPAGNSAEQELSKAETAESICQSDKIATLRVTNSAIGDLHSATLVPGIGSQAGPFIRAPSIDKYRDGCAAVLQDMPIVHLNG